MKRVALCLFGLSLLQHKHFNGNIYSVNYKRSVSNYREYIYKYFQEKGYTIDVYLSTNELNDTDKKELLETYRPIKYSFKKDEDNIYKSKNVKVDSVIDLCLSSNINYDLVLLTRFDLLFQKKFNHSNICFDKFNLVSILERPNLICDNFYLFPFNILPTFSTIVKNNINVWHHGIKNDIYSIHGPRFVNYILNENVVIADLSFYKIRREIN